ncbi:hypothetical protein TRFO_25873 [Tritrichomonas foetus]|uniref:Uncharacterized protein n=1 Tax=Tritrichomonas foetus TaxID=1144522 RepID=A0A1J4K921_9EUKA|nr:hypothetical protein TRFO_25873 [Tritrichomonas foetus]|eukprot:OHT06174.1 hypothetical protein TRFO_25873 [Tritrichomonas foetus]
MSSPVPSWLSRRLHTLKRTGVLTLIKEKNTDLSCLQLKDVISYIQFIKTLDLTGTPIDSLADLPVLPRVTNLVADYSNISNCINFSSVSTLTSISVKKTPLSQKPHYKLSILLAAGPNIVKIDGKQITQVLVNRCKSYPPYVSELVNRGWMAEYPCPDDNQLAELCRQYDVEIPAEEDRTEIGLEEESFPSSESCDEDTDFDTLAQKLWNQHEVMLQKKQALFGIIEEELSELIQDESDFGDRVATLFRSHGINVSANDENSILEAINDLCKRNDHKVPAYSP